MAFKTPPNYLEFYNEIVGRCHSLIELKYWDKIEPRTLDTWLDNFKTNEEQYLSALILYKLIYRNDKTIDSMLSKLFHITIPNILENNKIFIHAGSLEEWENKLKTSNFKRVTQFLFSTITSEELGDSGNDYMRRLRKQFVTKTLMTRITDKPDRSYKALIFIDDIIASGKQVSTFLKENQKNLEQYKYLIFTPLLAHKNGIQEIEREARSLNFKNNIIVKPLELIEANNSFLDFKVNEKGLFDNQNTIDELKTFYEGLIQEKKIEEEPLEYFGFGNLGLILMFATGIPDNTLPIIRKKGTDNKWNPLYEKF